MNSSWGWLIALNVCSPVRRSLDAPMLALAAAATTVIDIAQPPKSMPGRW
jgi:hypothetical protein